MHLDTLFLFKSQQKLLLPNLLIFTTKFYSDLLTTTLSLLNRKAHLILVQPWLYLYFVELSSLKKRVVCLGKRFDVKISGPTSAVAVLLQGAVRNSPDTVEAEVQKRQSHCTSFPTCLQLSWALQVFSGAYLHGGWTR